MNPDLDTVLDDCLSRLRAGVSIDECLAAHPAQAAALRSSLELAAAIHELPTPQPRPEAVQANRARMMAAVARRRAHAPALGTAPVSTSLLSRYTERILARFQGRKKEGKDMGFVIKFATAAIVVMMAFGTVSVGAAAVASADSLPGDALYPVKRAIEDVQLTLTPDEAARERIQIELEVRRRQEVQAVLQQQRRVEVQFWGTLESFDATQWVVDGFTVLVDGQTRIVGEPAEGAKVHVLGTTQGDGNVLASQLTVKKGAPNQQGPGWATPGPHGPGPGTPQPQGTQTQQRQGQPGGAGQGTPGPAGTPQGTQQRNREQQYGTPQVTPEPQGTQTQQRSRQQQYGTPQATPDPQGTQTQQRSRQQQYGTPQSTPSPQGTQTQQHSRQQSPGTPQAGAH